MGQKSHQGWDDEWVRLCGPFPNYVQRNGSRPPNSRVQRLHCDPADVNSAPDRRGRYNHVVPLMGDAHGEVWETVGFFVVSGAVKEAIGFQQ